jgi:hypothetical protein
MFLVLELDCKDIQVKNEESFKQAKKGQEYIYEHLKYALSKGPFFPSISVEVAENSIIATKGFHYLLIAKDLNRCRIRAIIEDSSSEKAVQKLLSNPSIQVIDWKKELDESPFVDWSWFIYFFEKPLSPEQKVKFEEQVVEFYKSFTLPPKWQGAKGRIRNLSYPFNGLCAEFEAYTPTGEHRDWHRGLTSINLVFHRETAPIVSFGGSTFRDN